MKVESISGSTVFVIEDDACLRAALKKLFESVGLHVELFPSGDAFLGSPIPNTAGCIVLAVRLPGMSGPKFQEELAKTKIRVPIVFLTGYGDIPMAVRAMKAGAVDFLTKPFREQDLLDAVTTALEQDGARRAEQLKNATLRESFDSLSAREPGCRRSGSSGSAEQANRCRIGTKRSHREGSSRQGHAQAPRKVKNDRGIAKSSPIQRATPQRRPILMPEGRASRVSSPPSRCRHLGKVLTDISGMRATSEAWPKGVRLPAVIVCKAR
jgi:FixJ family two-component response regulator